ncbi:plasmalemma vesicle-associated protein, partial [Egretta garzetta]|uniref:plasmalemma vesicle-associated protein n=1 Tax=Egretta garzetta TaxID=188379 RepID=UPI00051F0C97
MEKSSYTMAKFGLEAKEALPKRDCGFYVKYIFLFTSLIQFLIILGLVLFMVYGNAQAGTDTHLRLLEEQLQDRYNKIITLGGRNLNLTRTLNATLKEKQGLQVLVQKVQRDLDKCNSTQASASLTKATQEKESCQQELLTTKAVCESTQMNLELRKHECDSLRADTSNYFQHIKGMLSPYSCSEVHGQLSWLTKQMEQLFLRQQERESAYIGKKVCEMNVQQHRINCTREKQELEKRLQ